MRNNLTLEEITNRIVNVVAPTQRDIALTCARFQEKYEGAKFKDKDSFSRRAIWREWDKTEESKEDKYWTYWDGFNFTSDIIEIVMGKDYAPHIRREVFLDEITKPVIEKYGKVYLFGTFTGANAEVGRHEMGHALLYTNEDYKAEVMNIIKKLNPDVDAKLRQYFSKLGYHKDVMDDELHGWVMTETRKYLERAGIKLEQVSDVRKALNQNYDRFSPRK